MNKNLRLKDRPDWVYLLREVYDFYRASPSGGSSKVRSHQRTTREAISRIIKASPPLVFDPPEQKPVTVHLRRALDQGRRERHGSLIDTIASIAPQLSWRYGYDRMPKGLQKNYAYAEFTGPSGPVVTNETILGLVLFAPGTTYPAHAHNDITESYICLSGAVSENHQGVFASGSLIFNPPGHHHRITVSDREPALLAYAWTGPAEALAGQKMSFSRAKA